MSTPIQKTDAQWREALTPAAYDVLRRKGTERPFSGEYVHTSDDGVYRCAACGTELFSSDTKFDSGTAGRASPSPPCATTSSCTRTAACSCAVPRSPARRAAGTSGTSSTTARPARSATASTRPRSTSTRSATTDRRLLDADPERPAAAARGDRRARGPERSERWLALAPAAPGHGPRGPCPGEAFGFVVLVDRGVPARPSSRLRFRPRAELRSANPVALGFHA